MSNVSSLGDMRRKQEEEEKRNELYVGGTDNRGGGSGLAVLGPPGRPAGGDIFDSIVKRAMEPSHLPDGPPHGESNSRKITLYRNGFIIDDGPFRDINEPSSREFISYLEREEVPPELRVRVGPGTGPPPPLDLHMEDRRGEDYVPPPPVFTAFSGQGVSLRSESSSSSSSVFTAERLSSVAVTVDESAPTTVLQIRTHDGKKLRLKINQSSTVLQLAAMVRRDANITTSFALSAGFPPKDLTDGNATVQEAGLNGAAITVKPV